MAHHDKSRILILLTVLIMISTYSAQGSSSKASIMVKAGGRVFDGQILFSPYYTTTTYLIDSSGTVNHTWPSAYRPFTEPYWLGNGTILRPISSGGGGVQEIRWDGTLAWDYRYTVSGCTCHHDIKYLPNGNVLMIVWETKTKNEAIAAGRNPATISGSTFTSDKIIEVQPTGPTSGTVVWEWHVWDHLIQDFDASKANYGVVGDHPELIDVNFGDDFVGDWLHTNSVDYDPRFNQLLVDSHNFDEVWVIDHNTTTAEAAGHSGGHYGHGGDLLYRWGNPQAYRRGTSNDQKLYWQHDASWIKPGYPGAGHILVFNNGYNRPGTKYSTVDEFAPPIDSNGVYYLAPGSSYGPADFFWDFTATPPTSLYSTVFGGALRLTNGNTLICDGIPGKFLEVTPDKTVVWQWTNPYPSANQNSVFKIDYIPRELPPSPPQITGPTTGKVGVATQYNFTAVDPDGEDIFYCIDWGDQTTPTWRGPYRSGQEIPMNHTWTQTGSYWITAKAKDGHGESDWSDPFVVSIVGSTLELSIMGGIGVKAVIKNNGAASLAGVQWRIDVEGGLAGRINKTVNGTVDIPSGKSATVKTGMFFGLGPITITAVVDDEEKTATGEYFFFFSTMKQNIF